MIRDLRRQAPAARMIGEFAVKHGSRVVSERIGRLVSVVTTTSKGDASSAPVPASELVADDAPRAGTSPVAEPFPNYDTYTARQVLDRVATASESERAVVREYEAAHRARETILSALSSVRDVSDATVSH